MVMVPFTGDGEQKLALTSAKVTADCFSAEKPRIAQFSCGLARYGFSDFNLEAVKATAARTAAKG